jgi:prephenate dehydrogenase
MAVQITILGLGTLGVSMGLALAPAKDQVTRVGSDASNDAMRQAQKIGAFDRTTINLPDAVRQADAVVLCLPLGELRKTMEGIRQDLKPGVVVLDTSPVPVLTTAWAQELFPTQNCYFVSFTPAVNPAYLFEGPEPRPRRTRIISRAGRSTSLIPRASTLPRSSSAKTWPACWVDLRSFPRRRKWKGCWR